MCLGIPGLVVERQESGRRAGLRRGGIRRRPPQGLHRLRAREPAGRLRDRPRRHRHQPHRPGRGRAGLRLPRGERRPGRLGRGTGRARGGSAMKYLDEYRDPRVAGRLLGAIRRAATRPWTIMEVCGGQTHTLVRSGIDRLVPDGLRLVHGPGCPVCVTPLEQIDRALAIAARPGVIFTSFGDMLRVPGSSTDLLRVRAEGGDVRVVYSPLDAVRIARENPEREVVFFAVGFETTAPATALAARRGAAAGPGELLDAGRARPRPPGDGGHPRVADQPRAGLPRRRARLHRDGVRGVPGPRRALPRPDRRHGVRAGRPARGHPDGRPPARVGPVTRSRTSTPARSVAAGTGRRKRSSPRSTRSATAPGAAWACCRGAACG